MAYNPLAPLDQLNKVNQAVAGQTPQATQTPGQHWSQGWNPGYLSNGMNPSSYADDATAQFLAKQLGGDVVQTNPSKVFGPPPANHIALGGNDALNAGLLAQRYKFNSPEMADAMTRAEMAMMRPAQDMTARYNAMQATPTYDRSLAGLGANSMFKSAIGSNVQQPDISDAPSSAASLANLYGNGGFRQGVQPSMLMNQPQQPQIPMEQTRQQHMSQQMPPWMQQQQQPNPMQYAMLAQQRPQQQQFQMPQMPPQLQQFMQMQQMQQMQRPQMQQQYGGGFQNFNPATASQGAVGGGMNGLSQGEGFLRQYGGPQFQSQIDPAVAQNLAGMLGGMGGMFGGGQQGGSPYGYRAPSASQPSQQNLLQQLALLGGRGGPQSSGFDMNDPSVIHENPYMQMQQGYGQPQRQMPRGVNPLQSQFAGYGGQPQMGPYQGYEGANTNAISDAFKAPAAGWLMGKGLGPQYVDPAQQGPTMQSRVGNLVRNQRNGNFANGTESPVRLASF
jgi:hypothetical protein